VDGTATGGQDFDALNNVEVVFNAGDESKTVDIKINDDNEDESDEKFSLTLTCENPECVKVEGAEVEIKDDDSKIFISKQYSGNEKCILTLTTFYVSS